MICRASGLYQDFDFNRCTTTWPDSSRMISTNLVKFNRSFDYERFSSPLGTYFWSFVPNLACVQPTPTHRKKMGKVNCLLAQRRFTWGRTLMCLIQDVIYRKKVLKLKLNSIWDKIYKLLPPKVDLKLSLGGPLAIGVRSWKHNVFTWLSAPWNMRSFSLVRLRCLRIHQNRNKLIEIKVCPFVA